MMMRTWMKVAAVGLAVGILPAAVSRADAGFMSGAARRGTARNARARIADLEQQLDLSDGQKQQIESIMTQERPRVMPLLMQMMQDRKAMQSATPDSHTFNEEQVRAVASQQAKTLTDLMVEAQRVKVEVNAVLTPDQRAKFVQIMEQKRSEMRQRFSGLPAADALP